jgi:hypothetical protein
MKKFLLSTALIVATTLPALADNAVEAKDGLGDFLIAPFYMAEGDVCTKIVVENTNTTHSILAKVAIREQLASNEVDFPIFLSPGDVWSGKLCQGKDGDVYLYSTDDSNHPKIASLLARGKDITKQSIQAGNTNVDFTKGYIEVYPIAEFNEGSEDKVNKECLVKRWDMLIKGEMPTNIVKRGVDGYSLTGEVEFESKGAVTTILPMKAFKGTHDSTLTGSAIAYGNDTSPDILLGTTKKYQLLKLMQHNATMFHYSNYGKGQYVVFTYPFGYAKEQVRKYKVVVRDMSENKDVKKETIIFSPAPKIKSGNYMENEVVMIPVSDIIAKTKDPSMFKEGQIQITDITNVSNVQLGAGKNASFIPTYITIGKSSTEYVNSSNYLPVK